MEEYTKLINRLLDRAEVAESDELHTRNQLIQTIAELDKIKDANDYLKNEYIELKAMLEELEK